jgi:hypothetical protein
VPKSCAVQGALLALALDAAGLELAAGLEGNLVWALNSNLDFGRLRLLVHGVGPRATIGATVLVSKRVVASALTQGAACES